MINLYQLYEKIPIQYTYLGIVACIKKQNIFESSITSLEIKPQRKNSKWSKSTQENKLQIYLQNLFLEKYLSILGKNWGWSLCPPTTKVLQEEPQLIGIQKKRYEHRIKGSNKRYLLLHRRILPFR
jgi:hypothetical protein